MLRDAGYMEARDYETYVSLFNHMVSYPLPLPFPSSSRGCVCAGQANFMRKPNIIVHLDVSPEESLERIKLRFGSCRCWLGV